MNILYNAIQTPDGTIIESEHVHDYKTYRDNNGKKYMIDGGLSYVRSSNNGDEVWVGLTSDDDHMEIREKFKWGTRGISGKDPIKFVELKNLDTDHIEAIIKTQNQIPTHIKKTFEKELILRNNA